MAFKLIVIAAALACAQAGYLGAPLAAPVLAPTSIGASQQSVVRSLGGNQAVSTYSKAVDSAFSSVRKYDTRVTNDALSVAHAPLAYAAPAYAAPAYAASAYAAPALSYAAPALAPALAPAALSYSPAAVVSHATFTGLGAHYAY